MNTIIKKSLLSFFLKICGALSGLLMTTIVTRNLILESSGTFFLLFGILSVLLIFCSQGMQIGYVRFIAKLFSKNNWPKINSLFSIGIRYVFVLSVLISTIMFLASDFLSMHLLKNEGLSSVLKIFSISLPFFTISKLIGSALQGLDKTSWTVFLHNISVPILFSISVFNGYLCSIDFSLYTFSIYFLISSIFSFIISIFLWIKNRKKVDKIDTSENHFFLKTTKSLWVLSSATVLMEWSGVLLIGIFSNSGDVAIFSVAHRVSMLTSLVLISINLIAAPRYSSYFHNNEILKMRSTFYLCSKIIITLSFPILVFIILFSDQIMSFFGNDYYQGARILKILIVGQFITALCGSVEEILNMTGHENDMRSIRIFSLLIAFLLGSVLISFYGALGAAISTTLALSIQNLLAAYFVKIRLGWNPLKFWQIN
tara:strand:+ start:8736 stop:10019 length:1284 start_codon:yes stop_codon:yes gene_type:complete